MPRVPRLFACAAAAAVITAFVSVSQGVGRAQATTSPALDPMLLKAYQWRSIGPARAGRSIAVSGVKGRPLEAYAGQAGGGLWKTLDGGASWTPVTDGQIKSASVGAVAVSESDPAIVFIGMGESCIRGNILPGDGIYKSADAGKTWAHAGFSASDAISKIRIHPTDPNIVFVASFGKYSTASGERGVFKSTDGGKTWQRKLYRDDKTGAVDVAIDRNRPDVVYAALWEAYRVEYQMSSGGPGSGLFKSTDGGETWTEITRNPGLPAGVIGRIGIAVSGADSNRVYALVEAEAGGLFSSDDAGATWKLVNDGRNIRQRAFYYTHVIADPSSRDTVYLLNTSAFRSVDGGRTLTAIGNGTHGDHHDLWIDPDDARHLVIGNDGGGAVSTTTGRAWSPQEYATGQFYHVVTTRHVPFHVCGAQQDNSTICVPSDLPVGRAGGGRGAAPATYSAGGSEPGYIAPDPKNPDIFFAGGNNGSFLTRLNRQTNDLREVSPYPRMFSGEPASALAERWQCTYPIIFSPANPAVLYASSQHVWRTTDAGQSWQRISDDLTRHDPKTMGESGGPITHDMNSPEVYATVFALGPGRKDANILWAGSDDGLVHVTRDGGRTWTNVTPKDMPDFGRVSQIDASTFEPGGAYVAVKKPLLNDFGPYVFRTRDFGKTWTKIATGIRAGDYVNAVREDPVRRGFLYAGTAHGCYLSVDDGDHWEPFSLNLPDTPVADVWVDANAVAIATHGRGFYVLDDLAPLRQMGSAPSNAAVHLFTPADATRGSAGATITYALKQPAENLTIEILNSGKVVQTMKGAPRESGRGRGARGTAGEAAGAAPDDSDAPGGRGRGGAPTAPTAAGLNRVTWNLEYAGPTTFPGMVLWGATTSGPVALPGNYEVRLTVDGQSQTQPLIVRKHPWRAVSDEDLVEQFDVAMQIRDKVSEANTAVVRIRRIKEQVRDRLAKSQDAQLKAAAGRLLGNVSAVEEAIYQVRNQSNQDPLNFPIKINNRLASLLGVVERGEGRPTAAVYPIFKDLSAELKTQTDRLQQVLAADLSVFNAEARRAGLDPITAQ